MSASIQISAYLPLKVCSFGIISIQVFCNCSVLLQINTIVGFLFAAYLRKIRYLSTHLLYTKLMDF